MRLTQLEIENFKGIGRSQTIDLRPITLLFGSNSAGKSTILQALLYLRDVIESNNVDVDQPIAGGSTNLGGFENLAHLRDRNRVIRIKAHVELSGDDGTTHLPLNQETDGHRIFPFRWSYLGEEIVRNVGVGIEVAWDDSRPRERRPYLRRLVVDMNGEELATLNSPGPREQAETSRINWRHPLLRRGEPPSFTDTIAVALARASDDEAPSASEPEKLSSDELDDLPYQSLPNIVVQIPSDLTPARMQEPEWELKWDTLTFQVKNGLPCLDKRLGLDPIHQERDELERSFNDVHMGIDPDDLLRHVGVDPAWFHTHCPEYELPDDEDFYETNPRHNFNDEHLCKDLETLFDEILFGPVRILRDYLKTFTHIGPVREIPPRNHQLLRFRPDEPLLAQGLNSWNLLQSHELRSRVSDWLSRNLRTGYELVHKGDVEVDEHDEREEPKTSAKLAADLVLQDTETRFLVAPSDVGVGISQLLPVVVLCLRERSGLLAIEQPELHTHPATQVGIGDLFIESASNPECSLLVETHSEHILLRLLRRIREQANGELPEGVRGLSPEDLSVVFVEKRAEGTQFRRLRIDREGEFLDDWPLGFFEERYEELF